MKWIISFIIISFVISYIKGELERRRWLKDKNERTYRMVSTDACINDDSNYDIFGGTSLPSDKQVYLNIIVTDGYVIVGKTKYDRDTSGSYKSQSGDKLHFVEGGYLYVSYWEGDISAHEFVSSKDIEPIERPLKQKEQYHHSKKTFRQAEEKSNEEKILDTLGIHYIYHMTHVDNLNNILQNGLLSHGNRLVQTDISNQDVNSRRSIREPIYNKSIHSYVPFYFSPRNAMLYSKQEIQNHLVILALDRSLIYQPDSLYTDGNAAANETIFYNDLNQIQNLNWKCIHAKMWTDFQDGKRIKMAETLVFNNVETKYIQKIFCKNDQLKQYIERKIKHNSQIKIEVNQDLFF